MSLGGAYYQQTLKDEIDGFVFDPETFLFTAQNTDSESERRGIELTAGWAPLYNLEILAHYTYTDAREGNPAGNDLLELRRPRHQAGLNAQYRFAAVTPVSSTTFSTILPRSRASAC